MTFPEYILLRKTGLDKGYPVGMSVRVVLNKLIDVCRPNPLWAATFLNVVLNCIRMEKLEK